MTTLASASVSGENLEHRAHMADPLAVNLGLGLAVVTGSHMLFNSDAHCRPNSHIAGLDSPFGYKASTHSCESIRY